MAELTNQQKKDWAKTLYTKENLTQKEIASRVSVNPNTIGRWVQEGEWDKLRMSMLMTREEQLRNLYMELQELNEYIKTKDKGFRFADSKEADTRRKLIRDIKDLETKASIAEIIETAKKFITWIKLFDMELAKKISALFDDFIKDNLR
jgi:uncharacterized protein YjcR